MPPQPDLPSRTLGPVSDLERHLPADWWRSLFNAVYLKTDGDVVENDRATAAEVDAVVEVAGLAPGDRVLDVCCGQGRHTLELARRGFGPLVGVDRSRYLVRLARQRARRAGLDATFREGDARSIRLPAGAFDAVLLLGNSFGYFESAEDDLRVLETVRRVLRPGGTLVLDLTDGDWMRAHFEPRSWEWIDAEHLVCRERSLAADGERLVSREVVVHAERGVIVDQFYAERLYSPDALAALLDRAGFERVVSHGAVEGDSDRGQDLGMMAHRMLVTAGAPPAAGVPASGVPFPRVTVLLGDPRLPDEVKLGGQFNADDAATVARLKAALATLTDYAFDYVDDHATLLGRLRLDPPAFVLNLCDEGYRNDAFHELHVPAYLEMLGVPYSGAGPVCLGACYDKALVRAVAATLDVPVPLETLAAAGDPSATLPSGFPVLVKPNTGDSSIGITADAVCRTPAELVAAVGRLRVTLPGRPILVQEYLDGPEYSVGVVGNPGRGAHVLPVLEVDYRGLPDGLPPILGYESKWDPASPYWTDVRYVEAALPEADARALADHALRLFERLGCRDYARFDFRADAAGRVKLLEVNPNPGWCWDGKLALMAAMEETDYAGLLRRILEAAQDRVATERDVGHAERRVAEVL